MTNAFPKHSALDWIGFIGVQEYTYNSIFTKKSSFIYNKYFLIQILSSYHWSVFLDKTDPWFGVYGTTKNKTLFCFLPSFHPMVGPGRGVSGGGVADWRRGIAPPDDICYFFI